MQPRLRSKWTQAAAQQAAVVTWIVIWVPSSEAATMVLRFSSRHATRLELDRNALAVVGTAPARRFARSSVVVGRLAVDSVVTRPPPQDRVSVRNPAGVVPSPDRICVAVWARPADSFVLRAWAGMPVRQSVSAVAASQPDP